MESLSESLNSFSLLLISMGIGEGKGRELSKREIWRSIFVSFSFDLGPRDVLPRVQWIHGACISS